MTADQGPWYSTKDAAPLLGVRSAEAVRDLIYNQQLDAMLRNPAAPHRRIFVVSRQAIDRCNAARSLRRSA